MQRNHKAKKSLGQNFLKSESILKKIVDAGEINPVRGREGSQRASTSNGVKNQDLVLEIGPGRGALTEKLIQAGAKVLAVEKDNELFTLLQEKFSKQIGSGSLVLVHDDILNFNIDSCVRQDLTHYKIIANIPYNITGAILKKFLTAEQQPESMVLMVQHEVAQRIIANDGKESILSISVKAYGEPKMIAKVDKRFFSPAPKVNSAVIKINNISKNTFKKNNINEDKFWEIVKKGFAHKRKKLSGNLKGVIMREKLSKVGLQDKRAEDLSLKEWIDLSSNDTI